MQFRSCFRSYFRSGTTVAPWVLAGPVVVFCGALSSEGCVVPLSSGNTTGTATGGTTGTATGSTTGAATGSTTGAASGSTTGTASGTATGATGGGDGGTSGYQAGGAAGSDGGGGSGSSGATTGSASSGATTGSSAGDGGPAPSNAWTNATGNLAGIASECGNMSLVSAKPDEDMLIASVSLNGLWSSRNGGQSWQALGAGSATITNRGTAIVYDPTTTTRFWESGIYNGNGVYTTTDDGVTMAAVGTVPTSDLVSIDFSDPNRMTLVAGGHEMSQTLILSTDGGMTWNPIGTGLPANTNCTNPLVINSQTFLVGCGGYGGGVSGVWRTTNQGATWANVTMLGGAEAPLLASDGSIYWASPGTGGITRSTDQGVTWSTALGAQMVNPVHPVELPDGRIATIGPQTLVISSDQGMTWTAASTALPYSDATDLTYSKQENAFYIWHFTCTSFSMPVPVPNDGIMRYAM